MYAVTYIHGASGRRRSLVSGFHVAFLASIGTGGALQLRPMCKGTPKDRPGNYRQCRSIE